MTLKQEKFLRAYFESGGKLRVAAKAAGMSDIAGNLILEMPDAQEYLAELKYGAEEKSAITVEQVLADLEKAKGIALVGYDTKYGTRKDLGAFLKACELQGKYLKMWTENLNLNVSAHSKLVDLIEKRTNES